MRERSEQFARKDLGMKVSVMSQSPWLLAHVASGERWWLDALPPPTGGGRGGRAFHLRPVGVVISVVFMLTCVPNLRSVCYFFSAGGRKSRCSYNVEDAGFARIRRKGDVINQATVMHAEIAHPSRSSAARAHRRIGGTWLHALLYRQTNTRTLMRTATVTRCTQL